MQRSSRRLGRVAALALAVTALAAPATASAADNYVALGDSYSSGVGTNSYSLSSSCLRGIYAYPYLVGTQRPNTSLNFVACSGATTTSLMSSQIGAVNSATNIVSVSIGGNDIGFANLILQCTLGSCGTALANTNAALPGSLNSKLDTVYSAIRNQAAPGASVVVLGYPRLFSSSGCLGTSGISSSERVAANALADKLDQTIAAKAAQYGFTYKSAIGPFTGHAVCSSSAWVNGLNLFNSTESYHPNRNGNSQGYAPLVRQVIG
ncbi:MAG: SGNH/GDSL hydrolase family protein [Solirubrobacteraceae bacterium]|nr:SGNH/GDSL hydrolase family protein [Solirubrobacteraceae bacterium]